MIKKRAVLVDREFIRELSAGRDRLLRNIRHPIHGIRDFQAVPVNRQRFGQTVLQNNSNPVAFVRLNRRPRPPSIESPPIDGLPRSNFSASRLPHPLTYFFLSYHFPTT